MRTNAHNIWNYVALVGGKTCVINHHSVSYAWTKCATVCFDSAESLKAVIKTMPILKGANLYWFCFVLAKCAGCGKLGHISLACSVSEKKNKTLSNSDKSRLAAIYAKCSASVAYFLSLSSSSGWNILLKAGFFSEMKPILLVSIKLNNRFAVLKCSLASLAKHVNKLAKRLDTPGPTPLVTPSSQNQEADIVISEGSGVVTSGKTIAEMVVFDPSVISKMEETLNNLSVMVMGLSAKIKNTSMIPKVAMCNVRDMTNLAKQENIIRWHLESSNMVFVLTKTKLKFKDIRIFTSGLEENYLDTNVVIIEEISGQIVSVCLLFRNKLSVIFLSLYAGVLAKTKFVQAASVNALISKAVNMSFFVVLCGDFNENRTKKCASFRKCSDLGLVNLLGGFLLHKSSTWSKSREVALVSEFFDTNHNMVGISIGLEELVDAHLNNAAKWVHFKELSLAFLNLFSDFFLVTKENGNLNGMWEVFKDTVCGSANDVFSKHWFCEFDCSRNKQFLRFFKLKSLIAKILKCLCLGLMSELDWLVQKSKYYEAELVKSEYIRNAIDKRIESFGSNKSGMIRIRSRIDEIMVDWTCKRKYLHVDNNAFSEVMSNISLGKLSLVVSRLSDGKAAGLSRISNKLMMVCLLDLLNACLKAGNVPVSWKKVWDGVLTNTRPIALIETAKKILSKILLDYIMFMYNKFGILHGNNFSVLKDTSTWSSVFAVGSVVEDALEKSHEI
ncbi:hypothetical protein G9A89_016164 [Geosiphon pyriformis]|nr:hypothetical protein G9A89_016164 [Geosiphon pyriformis]